MNAMRIKIGKNKINKKIDNTMSIAVLIKKDNGFDTRIVLVLTSSSQ
jgi:hypothetical protein